MSQRKIGTVPLSCLMTGAVLGSGIIILPPLAIEVAGPWALPAWGATMLFGAAFAYIFARVGTLFPGEGGAADAVARAFGPWARDLGAYALAGAALFGPAAVMLTVADYLPPGLLPDTPAAHGAAAAAVQVGSALLLAGGLRTMSRVTTVLAVSATILLLAGAAVTLALHRSSEAAAALLAPPPLSVPTLGYTLLLLFFAVVGWEVVGNYGAEVRDPRRTMVRAALLAGAVVGLVSLAVAAGLQLGAFPQGAGHGVAGLLHPLFGPAAPWIMAALVAALCVTTYLMFVGAVVRLVAHLARQGGLPAWVGRRNGRGVPVAILAVYTLVHLGQLALVSLGVLDMAGILAIADGFFLVNALLGALAAARLLAAPLPRVVSLVLALCLFAVLLTSRWPVLAAIAIMALALGLRSARHRRPARKGPVVERVKPGP
ncbi:APC family permease [Pseudodesulfovibrio methanolicus]|uniref:APC family permease n=1 Tax=Pseudodesulfovibrio methanolicus TaxID=3126690 RepID=A0ABZ2J218_9BACT